ncbi:NAD(P)/FAD-dependent oxidoreductase [Streptomyces sp. NPDC053474]|uniref:NAD(P)/FAD-dependent oxidoreductase n=1 Tax=Streptomyces sp. NPDC053474 TaxID=3365704 RepID=UPI0037CF9AE8
MTSHCARTVVVGAGLAGARLAARLGPDALLIGEEPYAPYNRVLLADVLAGRLTPEVIALPAPARHLRARAVRVDRAERTVRCADGSLVAYETLVLATGANPVLPPLRGLFPPGATDLPGGVHAFRTLDDCLALSAAVTPGCRAVVIGGGLLGVCAARALADRGARVVLAQQGDHLMERQLDPAAADLVRAHLTRLGVEVHTQCRVRGVRRAGDGDAVTSVELADGFVLDTELTVLACGVAPRVGLARDAGLAVRRGIVVDDALRTDDPRVHAIGDCAEHAGRAPCLAAPALDQADALAAALTAPESARPYAGTRSLTRLTLPDAERPLDVAAFGEPEARPDDDVLRLADATRGTYRKVVVRGDRLVGGVLLGDLAAVGALARAWEADEPLPDDGAPPLHLLTHDGGH